MEKGEDEVENRHCNRARTSEWIDRVGAWQKNEDDATPPPPPLFDEDTWSGEGVFVA